MAKPATLDKTRSFATVHGISKVFYEQDHKEFDHRGIEIMANGEDTAPAGDYEDWSWQRLSKELKTRTGKGPKGNTKDQVIETLRALDAAEAVDADST